ncbi:MAG TPA: response regulator [Bacteroidota bacterium]|nr:response regulator [Bacteroidota bacterium]
MEILLVDDNADFLKAMKATLYEHGYTVYAADDGMEACKILSIKPVDLIISDIKMPSMDGIRLHQWVRNVRLYATTKFVFLSGYWDEYADGLTLSPDRDFLLNKATASSDIVRFVDRLLFGKYADLWFHDAGRVVS